MTLKTLDPTDVKLLELLQQDASLELSQLSVRVFKSPSSVHERIRKLKAAGVIRRYVAIIDPAVLGRGLLMLVQVGLASHTAGAFADFSAKAGEWEEVQQCWQLSGACDFMLQVAVKDSAAYEVFLREKLGVAGGVARVQGSVVLRSYK